METQGTDRAKSRTPTIDDLVALCNELNKYGVNYVVIGGFAVIYHGIHRGTEDIDLLVDPSPENIGKAQQALVNVLPDKVAKDTSPDAVEKYGTIRIADEIFVDLIKETCKVTYKDAGIEHYLYKGVDIPIVDLPTLIRTKQSVRPKDKLDLSELEDMLKYGQKENLLKPEA